MEIREPGVCGEGYYCLEDSGGQVAFRTSDCTGTSDEYEGEFTSTSGFLRLDRLDAGNESGSFEGLPLETTIAGSFSVTSEDGITLGGSFSVLDTLTANDAEETECTVSDGDENGDGTLDECFLETDEGGGCGCNTSGSPRLFWVLGVIPLWLGSRRREEPVRART